MYALMDICMHRGINQSIHIDSKHNHNRLVIVMVTVMVKVCYGMVWYGMVCHVCVLICLYVCACVCSVRFYCVLW